VVKRKLSELVLSAFDLGLEAGVSSCGRVLMVVGSVPFSGGVLHIWR